MTYWIAQAGQKMGPYPLEEVQRMLSSRSIAITDLAWTEGMPQWLPVGQVLSSAGAAPPGAPPIPGFARQQPMPPRTAGPIPPNLHWGLVLLFGFLTGIFTTVWLFIEAGFVKKIDPKSNAIMLLVLALALPVAFIVLMVGLLVANTSQPEAVLPALLFGIPIILGAVVCQIMAWFSMRTSLVNYYNTVEPIGLRLSGVMTFFFNVYYFQYHFTRIAEWKTTGVLTPQ